jgi:hypothetical protein
MADQRITELTEKIALVDNDVVVLVDSEAFPVETKKAKKSNLVRSFGTGWTADKLLKGAGPGADPVEIDLISVNIFGDGSDGNVTTAGNLTLTRDMYYNTFTISVGDIVYSNGFRIFCKVKFTSSTLLCHDGGNGGNGGVGTVASMFGTGAGGGGGDAGLQAIGFTVGSGVAADGGIAGGDGGAYPGNGSGAGSGVSYSGTKIIPLTATAPAAFAPAGGTGGTGGGPSHFTGGLGSISNGGGTVTVAKSEPRELMSALLAAELVNGTGIVHYRGPIPCPRGGGGGGGPSGDNGDSITGAGGGGGGGAGASGGVIMLAAAEIDNSAGTIRARGGNGGNGGAGGAGAGAHGGGGGGGGGGGAGGGGIIILIYKKASWNVEYCPKGVGGTGGAGGAATGTGTPGAAGPNGPSDTQDGAVYKIEL